jgi:hypothetical protein
MAQDLAQDPRFQVAYANYMNKMEIQSQPSITILNNYINLLSDEERP